MTQKKEKRYWNAVRRRLNLPEEIKEQAMSSLLDGIQKRRETGMPWEEIRKELGTPSNAAAELTEPWKAYAYRKSPWRWLFGACAVYAGGKLLSGVWVNMLYGILRIVYDIRSFFSPMESYSIGIIGGADGPTAMFVTAPVWTSYLGYGILFVLGIFGYLRLSRCRQKKEPRKL